MRTLDEEITDDLCAIAIDIAIHEKHLSEREIINSFAAYESNTLLERVKNHLSNLKKDNSEASNQLKSNDHVDEYLTLIGI